MSEMLVWVAFYAGAVLFSAVTTRLVLVAILRGVIRELHR